jgi:hypothetical membrane protein
MDTHCSAGKLGRLPDERPRPDFLAWAQVVIGDPGSQEDAMPIAQLTTEFTTSTDRVPAVRVAALAGIAGPILFTLTFLAQQVVRRAEYDPIAEPVSALEAGPNGWIQQANFVVFGVLLLIFAIGVQRGVARSRFGSLGPALLGVASIGLFLAAALPLREDAAGVTYDPGGHFIAGVTFFLSISLAMLALSRRLAKDPQFRTLAIYTAVCGVLALVGFVVMGRFAMPDDAPLHEVAGLLQRTVIMVVTFPCLVILAVRLLRTSR